jgi:uncharacterized protein with FMN-binding domain
MKKKIKYIIVILVFFISIFIIEIIRMNNQVKAFDKTPIDISQVADGVYNGHSETDLVKVEVSVKISDGMLQDIEILRHECGKGHPANKIVKDMLKKNDIEVDAISGATMSSEVIKDAVRNALREGL